MAKSLRSKSKLRTKSIKLKAVFKPKYEERELRISERLAAQHEADKITREEEGKTGDTEAMVVDSKALPARTKNNKKYQRKTNGKKSSIVFNVKGSFKKAKKAKSKKIN